MKENSEEGEDISHLLYYEVQILRLEVVSSIPRNCLFSLVFKKGSQRIETNKKFVVEDITKSVSINEIYTFSQELGKGLSQREKQVEVNLVAWKQEQKIASSLVKLSLSACASRAIEVTLILESGDQIVAKLLYSVKCKKLIQKEVSKRAEEVSQSQVDQFHQTQQEPVLHKQDKNKESIIHDEKQDKKEEQTNQLIQMNSSSFEQASCNLLGSDPSVHSSKKQGEKKNIFIFKTSRNSNLNTSAKSSQKVDANLMNQIVEKTPNSSHNLQDPSPFKINRLKEEEKIAIKLIQSEMQDSLTQKQDLVNPYPNKSIIKSDTQNHYNNSNIPFVNSASKKAKTKKEEFYNKSPDQTQLMTPRTKTPMPTPQPISSRQSEYSQSFISDHQSSFDQISQKSHKNDERQENNGSHSKWSSKQRQNQELYSEREYKSNQAVEERHMHYLNVDSHKKPDLNEFKKMKISEIQKIKKMIQQLKLEGEAEEAERSAFEGHSSQETGGHDSSRIHQESHFEGDEETVTSGDEAERTYNKHKNIEFQDMIEQNQFELLESKIKLEKSQNDIMNLNQLCQNYQFQLQENQDLFLTCKQQLIELHQNNEELHQNNEELLEQIQESEQKITHLEIELEEIKQSLKNCEKQETQQYQGDIENLKKVVQQQQDNISTFQAREDLIQQTLDLSNQEKMLLSNQIQVVQKQNEELQQQIQAAAQNYSQSLSQLQEENTILMNNIRSAMSLVSSSEQKMSASNQHNHNGYKQELEESVNNQLQLQSEMELYKSKLVEIQLHLQNKEEQIKLLSLELQEQKINYEISIHNNKAKQISITQTQSTQTDQIEQQLSNNNKKDCQLNQQQQSQLNQKISSNQNSPNKIITQHIQTQISSCEMRQECETPQQKQSGAIYQTPLNDQNLRQTFSLEQSQLMYYSFGGGGCGFVQENDKSNSLLQEQCIKLEEKFYLGERKLKEMKEEYQNKQFELDKLLNLKNFYYLKAQELERVNQELEFNLIQTKQDLCECLNTAFQTNGERFLNLIENGVSFREHPIKQSEFR